MDNVVPLNEMSRKAFLEYAGKVEKDSAKSEQKPRVKFRRPKIRRM